MSKTRCSWVNLNNPVYVQYHDKEWGKPVHDDRVHFEFITLEGAQAGLSWEIVLNKRENYRKLFANFDPKKVARFSIEKVAELFYADGICCDDKELNTTLKFVVEKDGSISEITAEGETPSFNKQAEIALYLLPDKFQKPGTVNGNAVRYVFRMPIRMRLE